ncbi:MAG: hypothetical protein OSB37_05125 [Acidimicrobiales bacterium]|nr:hypothetical protein [Acidimicrobiales bacterium]MDE0749349.1 hypothetical protein [Acidimicrobiales bacterium]
MPDESREHAVQCAESRFEDLVVGPSRQLLSRAPGVEADQDRGAGRLTRNLAATPMGLRKILTHTFPLDEWRSAPSPTREAVAP